MDIKEFVQEKRDLERRLQIAIQAEINTFTAKTLQGVGDVSISIVDCSTLDGSPRSVVGSVRIGVQLR